MKINFILPYANMSGGVRVVAMHAQELQRRGHDVCVISTPHRWPSRRERAMNFVHRMTLWLQGRKEPSHLDGTGLDHRTISHQPPVTDDDVPDGDVVVATWWETAEWVDALSERKGAKAYFIQGFETHHHRYEDRIRATWKLPMHKIVVAHWLEALSRTEFDDADVSTVFNAVDTTHFRADPREKNEIPTVGLLYSTKHCKGIDICLQAIAHAQRELPRLRLIAFGSEPVSSDLPLPNNSTYYNLPAQNELPSIYASCDAWLFGSRREGFGLPILEAMACRTPVIATPAGAAPELVTSAGGILLSDCDANAMTDAIVDLARLTNEKWKAMSNAAHLIANQHTWEQASIRFEQALECAVERRSKSRSHSRRDCRCGT